VRTTLTAAIATAAVVAMAVAVTTTRLVASHAYAEGAPGGFTGGFNEDTCRACHFDADLNAGGGRVTIEGLPVRYAAGERYTLTVTLTRTGMKRAGFQLAARFENTGAQAGSLAPGAGDGERVGVDSQDGVRYAGQKKAGSSVAASDTATWTLEWTAPATGGAVIFHVAANAANGDESANGDFVYSASGESRPPPR
jgi:hypothetical protein